MMPGGDQEAYAKISHLFEAAAAKVKGDPCVAYLGPRSAGHYVKMVHNGIEYALMELISETYDLLKRGLGFNDEELETVFREWNKGELRSYLLEITSRIFGVVDEKTKNDWSTRSSVARQKGTGMWTSQSAMELQVPTPTIDLAVSRRDLSMFVEERKQVSQKLGQKISLFRGDKKVFLKQVHDAFYASMIISYTQGMALLKVASEKLGYNLQLETVAKYGEGAASSVPIFWKIFERPTKKIQHCQIFF